MTAVPARTAEVPARARRRLRDLRELRGRGTGRAGRCCGVARAGLAGVLRAGASRVGATWVAALGRAGVFAAAGLPAGRLPGARAGLARLYPGRLAAQAAKTFGVPVARIGELRLAVARIGEARLAVARFRETPLAVARIGEALLAVARLRSDRAIARFREPGPAVARLRKTGPSVPRFGKPSMTVAPFREARLPVPRPRSSRAVTRFSEPSLVVTRLGKASRTIPRFRESRLTVARIRELGLTVRPISKLLLTIRRVSEPGLAVAGIGELRLGVARIGLRRPQPWIGALRLVSRISELRRRPETRISELRPGQPRIGKLRPNGTRDREPRLTQPRISVLRPEPRISELRRPGIRIITELGPTVPGFTRLRPGGTRDRKPRLAVARIATLRPGVAGLGALGLTKPGIGTLRPIQPRPGTFRVARSRLRAPGPAAGIGMPGPAILCVGRSWLPVATRTRPLGPVTAATGLLRAAGLWPRLPALASAAPLTWNVGLPGLRRAASAQVLEPLVVRVIAEAACAALPLSLVVIGPGVPGLLLPRGRTRRDGLRNRPPRRAESPRGPPPLREALAVRVVPAGLLPRLDVFAFLRPSAAHKSQLPLTLGVASSGRRGHYIMRQDRRCPPRNRQCWGRALLRRPLAAHRSATDDPGR